MSKLITETIVLLKNTVGELALLLMEAVIEAMVDAVAELF
jgi:hypothetical protein